MWFIFFVLERSVVFSSCCDGFGFKRRRLHIPICWFTEPFSGLNEMNFKFHGIYTDHELEQEFVTSKEKCKDVFLILNVLIDENLRNFSMADEVRAQVYHVNDWQSDEEEQEQVKNKYIIYDPNTRWDNMELKLGDIFEPVTQLKFFLSKTM
ncbi:unnamed protein product [Lactuca virosa]|uniref:Uncharacterized protein n=1 Tax=Lactuca virosa TaxID=75947 RepID=A0AAU9NTL3_9ASTR|nr:unnamed protein product [Lactuca virosa]